MDLVITYDNKNGEKIRREYPAFADFADEMERNQADISMLNSNHIHAEFYSSNLVVKDFKDVTELCDFVDSLVKDYTKERDEIKEL